VTLIRNGVELEPTYQGKPDQPLRDMLRWLTTKEPPKFVRGYTYTKLTDEEHMLLQEWAVNTLDSTPVHWGTGIGIIEAAEKLVYEAVSNGNIPAEDSKWRTQGTPKEFYEPREKHVGRRTSKRTRKKSKRSKR
jgi:hypothetical protein